MRNYIISIVCIFLLAMSASASFPVDDAGIAAYVKVGNSVDLNKTVLVFSEIGSITSKDIIGKVSIPYYIQRSDPLIYVGADGWVVAYYPKSEPASRIMQWQGYLPPNITTTTLADAISKMVTGMGMNYGNIKGNISYYDFRYPDATKLIMAVKTGRSYSFTLMIPSTSSQKIINASFSYYVDAWDGSLMLDNTVVSGLHGSFDAKKMNYGFYNLSQFTYNIAHTITISGDGPGGASTVFIIGNKS